MHPHQPETLIDAQRRYPAAVAEVYDVESIKLGTVDPPSRHRRHVFDFADGLRLIISRERYEDGRLLVHVSASFACGSELHRQFPGLMEFMRLACRRFWDVSGDRRVMRFVGITCGNVPHWLVGEEAHHV